MCGCLPPAQKRGLGGVGSEASIAPYPIVWDPAGSFPWLGLSAWETMGDRVSPPPSFPWRIASKDYTTRAEAAGGIGVGRGKGFWDGEETREGKGGGHGSGCQEGGNFCMWMRTGMDSGREQRSLGSWWGERSDRREVQLEVAVGDFKDTSLPLPQADVFSAPTPHSPGELDPHPKDPQDADLSPSLPPLPQLLMCLSIP